MRIAVWKPLKPVACTVCGCRISRMGRNKPRFCSKACQRIGGKKPNRRLAPILERQCQWCEKWFQTRNQCRRFCSRSCGVLNRHGGGRPLQVCQHCGKQYKPKAYNRLTFCSRECCYKNRKKSAGTYYRSAIADGMLIWASRWKVCKQCRCAFYGRGNICSEVCRSASQLSKYYQDVPREYTAVCVRCGVVFKGRRPGRARQCKSCRQSSEKMCNRNCKHRRKARIKGNMVGKVSIRQVFERDGWRCYLCNKALSQDVKVPNDDAPTIDHVIPLAKGGSHSMENLRACCFKCNYTKCDSM